MSAAPDPLWVRMVMDVADQLWQAGDKRASGDLHEALRLAAVPASDGLAAGVAALAEEWERLAGLGARHESLWFTAGELRALLATHGPTP